MYLNIYIIIFISESLDRQYKDKKIKYDRVITKYGGNLARPRAQAKVAQAK